MNEIDDFTAGQLVEIRFYDNDALSVAITCCCGKGPYRVLFVHPADEEGPAVAWIGPHTIDPKIAARFFPNRWEYQETKSQLIAAVPAQYLKHVCN